MSLYILGSISALCMVSGAVVARVSDRSRSYAKRLEILVGVLLMGGLSVLDLMIVVGP